MKLSSKTVELKSALANGAIPYSADVDFFFFEIEVVDFSLGRFLTLVWSTDRSMVGWVLKASESVFGYVGYRWDENAKWKIVSAFPLC